MTTLPDVPGLRKQGPAVHRELVALAGRHGLDVDHLAALIAHESGWNPAARNPVTQAVGLIQFMPRYTRQLFGLSADQIAKLSTLEQLALVERFFAGVAQRIGHPIGADVAIAAFLPAHVGKPDGFVAFERPSKGYWQNAPLDLDKDGRITLGEVRADVARMLEGRARFEVDASSSSSSSSAPPAPPSSPGPSAPPAVSSANGKGSIGAIVVMLAAIAVPLLARGIA